MTEIGVVLMPADIGIFAGILHPGGVLIEQDIGPDQILYDIQDRGLRRQAICPGIAEVEFGTGRPAKRPSHRGFHGFELLPALSGSGRRQDPNRRDESSAPIILHLLLRQPLGHCVGRSPAVQKSRRSVCGSGTTSVLLSRKKSSVFSLQTFSFQVPLFPRPRATSPLASHGMVNAPGSSTPTITSSFFPPLVSR